ncbi:MAG: EAL domain-containing protein [Pseudanabaenaceae cyanobacterium bins.39]|nr:EAL domain-containing protein [Pseudanabaenaceae cyanobacterium bins.39]
MTAANQTIKSNPIFADQLDRMPVVWIIDKSSHNIEILISILSTQNLQIHTFIDDTFAANTDSFALPNVILITPDTRSIEEYQPWQFLRSSPNLQHIPIIIIVEYCDPIAKTKAFNLGIADYIVKPFHRQEVLNRINHQLLIRSSQNCSQSFQVSAKPESISLQILPSKQCDIDLRKQQLESILNSLDDSVWSIKPDFSAFIYLNNATEKIYGYPNSTFLENPAFWSEVIHPEDRGRVISAHNHLLNIGFVHHEYRIIRPSGEVRWISDRSYLVNDAQGNVVRIDGIIQDITDQKNTQQQLEHNALHDGLTGLPNRNLFMDRVDRALQYSKRHPRYQFALMFIDLDRFKMINDNLGHLVGDQFLQAIAHLLSSCLRSGDTVARLGGDEFTILIDDIESYQEPLVVADRILNKLQQPIEVKKQTISGSASIGIVISTRDHESAADLLHDADIAMYHAKSLGKGRYALFDKEMYEQNLRIVQIDSDLRYALERQELEILYQPIFALRTNQLDSLEALIRWNHPQRGLISPNEFIPIAEETGLIIAIGDWVLSQSCQQMCKWQSQFAKAQSLKINVNLTCHQIREAQLVEKLDRILRETGISGKNLRLEITEATMMDQGEDTILMLEKLRSRGILLSIDDFGQGYSSLSYLHRFPVNSLKIDRSFVEKMSFGGQNLEVVRTIILLAHTLQIAVVAEGVETRQQLALLKEIDCDYAQGYLFSRPLSALDVEKLFLHQA